MSSRSQRQGDSPRCQQLLGLGERLVAQPTIAAQQKLIVETAASLLNCQAELWLVQPADEASVPSGAALVSPTVPSTLMRQVQATAQADGELSDGPVYALPLLLQDLVLGVLQVRRDDGPPFTADEISLLNDLVSQSTVALQATRQLVAERWRLKQLALVRAVSAQVANVLDLDDLASMVVNLILHTFGYYYVALFTSEPGDEQLRLRASAGRPERPRPDEYKATTTLHVAVGQGIIGHVAETGREIIARDVNQEPLYRYVETLPETRSEVALPLKIEDRLMGVLDVQSELPDNFTETDMVVLQALADNIAVAVEHARLYSDLRRRADQLAAIAEISRAVSSILDLDRLFDEVVDLLHHRFGFPFVHLFTVDPTRQQIVFRAGRGVYSDTLRAERVVYHLDDDTHIVPRVARSGETTAIDDATEASFCSLSGSLPHQARAVLDVPLSFAGNILGVLDVRDDHPHAFGPEDRFLFEALADSVAIAIRNANLYRSERWRRQVADSLREAAGALSADLALEQVLDAILSELERTLPCDVAAVWLLHDDDLCLSAAHGFPTEMCMGDLSTEAVPWLHQALHAERPLIRFPHTAPEPLGAILGFPPDYSAIAAPLHVGDHRLGLLTLAHRTPGRYGSEAELMSAAFASYASVAIENARLYQTAQDQALISTVMLRVAEATQSLTTIDRVLETIVHLVPTLVGVERCAVVLWEETSESFVMAAAYGLSQTSERWRVAVGEEPAFDDLLEKKQPLFIYDVATDQRLTSPELWALGFESLLMLPLLAQGQVLGAILVDYQGEWLGGGPAEIFRSERLTIIQGIAYQAAAAVENTQLREAQQEEAYVSAALLQVAQAVAMLSDLDEILQLIVRITPILVGVERCVIFLRDEQNVFYVAGDYGIPRELAAEFRRQAFASGDFPLLDQACQHGEQVQCNLDSRQTGEWDMLPPAFVAAFLRRDEEGPRHLLAVPLSVKGDELGVMVLEERQTTPRMRAKRLEIITGIAHQAALAVQNDRLQQEMAERERLEQEVQLARSIQETFIPSELPELPGWEVAAIWRAAREVAGDLYDVFPLPGGRFGLVIADVADKGMPAALFMTLTRTLIRAAARENRSPAAVLTRVNDLLEPDAPHGMFVTTFYAIISPEKGELNYTIAGHNPPMLWHAQRRELEKLPKGGMALGVVEGVKLEDRLLRLEPGDALTLYTDGVTEAFSPQEEIYGEQRLRATIESAGGESAQDILERIDDSVTEFIGPYPPSDDFTLVVLRRLA